ncbi:MAG: putative dehydrogenase [Kiritimatiellia bacterium]|jgi:predicted dehydrogenase
MKNTTARSSRRNFIATSTAAVAAPLILPSGLRGATANEKLHVGFIGMGGQIQGHVKNLVNMGHHAVAFCDVDRRQLASSQQRHGDAGAKAKLYEDYRKLFEQETSLDAVVIATPDHWHLPVCKAAFAAGKHIYCEKPLTHTVGEARELRELTRESKVITQTGNQGSASGNLRRSVELIQSGLLGQITEIHIWHNDHAWPGDTANIDQADPIPQELNWDFWCGPSKVRPYKDKVYHPAKWRGWFDYGNGFIGDFCCHAFNMPVRALNLDYPDRLEITGTELGHDCYPKNSRINYHFPARGTRGPVQLSVYDGGVYPENGELDELVGTFGQRPRVGCLLIGEKGQLSAGLWNSDCYIKLNDDAKFVGWANHEQAKAVPETLPRVAGHMNEWVDAIYGGPKTYSDFDFGGHLTELGLTGNVALRMMKDIPWDGEKMQVPGMPEADRFIHTKDRTKWI